MDQSKRNMRAEVMAALGICETQYGMRQFECGMDYLEVHCTSADVQRLSADIDFWSWWRLSWEARDLVLLVQLERGMIDGTKARENWEAMHEPGAIMDKVPAFIDRKKVTAP